MIEPRILNSQSKQATDSIDLTAKARESERATQPLRAAESTTVNNPYDSAGGFAALTSDLGAFGSSFLTPLTPALADITQEMPDSSNTSLQALLGVAGGLSNQLTQVSVGSPSAEGVKAQLQNAATLEGKEVSDENLKTNMQAVAEPDFVESVLEVAENTIEDLSDVVVAVGTSISSGVNDFLSGAGGIAGDFLGDLGGALNALGAVGGLDIINQVRPAGGTNDLLNGIISGAAATATSYQSFPGQPPGSFSLSPIQNLVNLLDPAQPQAFANVGVGGGLAVEMTELLQNNQIDVATARVQDLPTNQGKSPQQLQQELLNIPTNISTQVTPPTSVRNVTVTTQATTQPFDPKTLTQQRHSSVNPNVYIEGITVAYGSDVARDVANGIPLQQSLSNRGISSTSQQTQSGTQRTTTQQAQTIEGEILPPEQADPTVTGTPANTTYQTIEAGQSDYDYLLSENKTIEPAPKPVQVASTDEIDVMFTGIRRQITEMTILQRIPNSAYFEKGLSGQIYQVEDEQIYLDNLLRKQDGLGDLVGKPYAHFYILRDGSLKTGLAIEEEPELGTRDGQNLTLKVMIFCDTDFGKNSEPRRTTNNRSKDHLINMKGSQYQTLEALMRSFHTAYPLARIVSASETTPPEGIAGGTTQRFTTSVNNLRESLDIRNVNANFKDQKIYTQDELVAAAERYSQFDAARKAALEKELQRAQIQ